MARARPAIALTVAVALAPVQVGARTPTTGATPEAAPAPATPTDATPASPAASIPATPRDPSGTFTTQDGWTTPKPGPATSDKNTPPERRWQIRQAPLAGAESSWGPPGGQMPEYAEFTETPATTGPPPRGTPRIVTGAIVGPLGLGLAIAGVVGATTDMLGDNKRLSVPMVGFGIVASAIGWGLFADGILRRKKFMRWQAKGGQLTISPALVPGRLAGVSLGLRF